LSHAPLVTNLTTPRELSVALVTSSDIREVLMTHVIATVKYLYFVQVT
jgi:hypothetical protein